MPKIILGDVELYYEVHGEGAPVILIGGYTCDHTFWKPITELLSLEMKVVLFDNRASGQTTDRGDPLTMEKMAADVLALARHLKLQRPHIVGESMGGTIAQHLAVRHPDEIGKLVIMNSSSKWREAVLMGLEGLLQMRRKNVPFELVFPIITALLYGENFLKNREKLQKLKEEMVSNPFAQSLANQERQFALLKNFDGRQRLKQIKAPTLIIHGREDLIALPPEAEAMATHIPNSKFSLLPCAHACVPEVPELVIPLLAHFLR